MTNRQKDIIEEIKYILGEFKKYHPAGYHILDTCVSENNGNAVFSWTKKYDGTCSVPVSCSIRIGKRGGIYYYDSVNNKYINTSELSKAVINAR